MLSAQDTRQQVQHEEGCHCIMAMLDLNSMPNSCILMGVRLSTSTRIQHSALHRRPCRT